MSTSRWPGRLLAGLLLLCVQRADGQQGLPPVASTIAPAQDFALPPPPPRLAEAVDLEARLSLSSHPRPPGAPDVVVHAPAGVDLADTSLVIYLHGWEGCARAIAATGPVPCRPGEAPQAGWGLAARHDAAGTDSIMVVPQLMWLARSGDPGRFREPGFAAAWLQALVDEVLVPLVGLKGRGALREVVLVAHSGGYLTTLALLKNGELPVSSVVLLDALYGGGAQVADWTLAGPARRAVSLFTQHPGTTGQSLLLARRAQAGASVAIDPSDLEAALRDHRVVVAPTSAPHGLVPARSMATVLAGLGLRSRG